MLIFGTYRVLGSNCLNSSLKFDILSVVEYAANGKAQNNTLYSYMCKINMYVNVHYGCITRKTRFGLVFELHRSDQI